MGDEPKGRPVRELAALVGGEVDGDPALLITGLSGLEAATAGQLSFYGNPRYKRQLAVTRASAVLVPLEPPPRQGATFIRVRNPHLAFARIASALQPPREYAAGVAAGAHVQPGASVDPTATVMAGATVQGGAFVGARAVLYPGVFVGEGARIGADTLLYPNVCVADRCLVGARCVLHAGAVVGADGFGFAFDPEGPAHVKIPQVGIVRLEDDVELGANSCVDRATTGETVVGRGAKIDNLVQVGHNSTVGPLAILCAQVGLAGSTEIGTGAVLAGQVGAAGHLRIGDMAKVGAQGGVIADVADGAVVVGTPSMPHKAFMRSSSYFQKLPELARTLRELEKRLTALEKERTS